MTFQADEESQQGSRPKEVFDFLVGTTHYRHTTQPVDVVFGGNTYAAGAIRRGNTGASPGDQPEVLVEVPTSSALVVALRRSLPSQVASVTITRIEASGASRQVWSGPLAPLVMKGDISQIKIPTRFDDANTLLIPSVSCSVRCQNELADDSCKALLANLIVTTTVSSVAGTTLVLTSVASADEPTPPTNWFQGGALVIGGTITTQVIDGITVTRIEGGEQRTITSQTGTTVKILGPLYGLTSGQTVIVAPGCDKFARTCRDKYSNVTHFVGMPNLSFVNPFETTWK